MISIKKKKKSIRTICFMEKKKKIKSSQKMKRKKKKKNQSLSFYILIDEVMESNHEGLIEVSLKVYYFFSPNFCLDSLLACQWLSATRMTFSSDSL